MAGPKVETCSQGGKHWIPAEKNRTFTSNVMKWFTLKRMRLAIIYCRESLPSCESSFFRTWNEQKKHFMVSWTVSASNVVILECLLVKRICEMVSNKMTAHRRSKMFSALLSQQRQHVWNISLNMLGWTEIWQSTESSWRCKKMSFFLWLTQVLSKPKQSKTAVESL